MDLFAEIKGIIVEELAVDESDIVPEAHIQGDLGADSLELIGLAETINERYDVDVNEDDFQSIDNVGELVELVEARIKAKS